MTARPLSFLAALSVFAGLAGLAGGASFVAACSSSPPVSDTCESSSDDPCACVVPPLGATCVAMGPICACSSDGGSFAVADAATPPDVSAFVGQWSPLSGTGQSNCGGATSALQPNPAAVLTFTQDGPSSLSATSSGAGDCTLALSVSANTASLATAGQSCSSTTGDVVTYQTFTLVFTPTDAGTTSDIAKSSSASDRPATDDGGIGADASSSADDDAGASDAEVDDAAPLPDAASPPDAAPPVDAAPPPADAGTDAAEPSADAATDAATTDADGAAPPQGTLDWELTDGDGTCTTTLHYTLVRTR